MKIKVFYVVYTVHPKTIRTLFASFFKRTGELLPMVPLTLLILSTSRTRYSKKKLTLKKWVKDNFILQYGGRGI